MFRSENMSFDLIHRFLHLFWCSLPVCCDERQYVGHEGQQWTTQSLMPKDNFRNEFREYEPVPDLSGRGTTHLSGGVNHVCFCP